MAVVGLISDTHGTLNPLVYDTLWGCDAIIHAGDIGNSRVLDELRSIAPVHAVLGNCDVFDFGPSVGLVSRPLIAGVRFLVAHYPQDVRPTAFGSATLAPGDPIPDVCVHGHVHVPRIEFGPEVRPAQLLICPGSASFPRNGWPASVGFVHILEGRVESVTIRALTGGTLMSWE